ncbi:MAG: hypothetical protein HC822_21000 [Oscillochloris sp.]|nr:hypothetical protein [Oscillochloris sp.]
MTIAFLALPAGPELLDRLVRAERRAGHFALPVTTLHSLYEQGVTPAQLVRLAEALPAFADLAERILPTANPANYRRRKRGRRRWIDLLLKRIHILALRAGDADVLAGARQLVEHGLKLLNDDRLLDRGRAPRLHGLSPLFDLANEAHPATPGAIACLLQQLDTVWPWR